MAISQQDLRTASVYNFSARSAKRIGQTTAFLCHSHKDEQLALGLQELLRNHGVDLYIDWQDSSMPDRPSKVTAQQIKTRIITADWFLFLATDNSTRSRWCPWELGYADGTKQISRIAIVPTTDSAGTTHGNEYLDLYRRIDVSSARDLVAIDPGRYTGTPVRQVFP
ncbi:toll/interleukin-1 receptor domain-containing protein [Cupriavidus necator]|uniref:toll/interleukin-1 receptor domain-containing protein n=1 Tax=Cupriavidus necator TaxID=106590 RepID=UPI003ECD7F37